MTPARLLLADDHRIVVEGLRAILTPEFDLVGIVDDGRKLVEAAMELAPEIILADISMPHLNGLDAISQLKDLGCTAKVVFLTMHKDATYAARALALGASGFVLKHAASTELLEAIRTAIVSRTHVASIGPTCSEALTDNGFPVHYEASPPKMGPLIRGAIECWRSRPVSPGE